MRTARRRVVVAMFAATLAMFGAFDATASQSARETDRTTSHDSAKRKCNKGGKKPGKKCRGNKSGDGNPTNCHSSYPDFCIPPPPPDKDCADAGGSDFTVVGTDPHGFDGDNDGVGCES